MNHQSVNILAGGATIAACLVAASAFSAAVYEQYPNPNSGVISDADFPEFAAEQFVLTQPTRIDSILWRGSYNREDVNGAPVDNFTVDIYADALVGVSPGALLQSYAAGSGARADTGIDIAAGTSNLYEYSYSLGSGLSLPAGTYWLGINNDTSAPSPALNDWSWLAVSVGNLPHARSDNKTNWLSFSPGPDTHFAFFGEFDSDSDGLFDDEDNCPNVANVDQTNTDGAPDGGDACDTDDDNDTWEDFYDNCPLVANVDQLDTNEDGVGDACDPDGDGVPSDIDNCPLIPNPDQSDADNSGRGDACDGLPNGC